MDGSAWYTRGHSDLQRTALQPPANGRFSPMQRAGQDGWGQNKRLAVNHEICHRQLLSMLTVDACRVFMQSRLGTYAVVECV